MPARRGLPDADVGACRTRPGGVCRQIGVLGAGVGIASWGTTVHSKPVNYRDVRTVHTVSPYSVIRRGGVSSVCLLRL